MQHDGQLLERMFDEVRAQCPGAPAAIHYYGTGVVSESIASTIHAQAKSTFGDVRLTCESDLLAAARALSAGTPGIICILGTGSNSCVFDGKKVTAQIPSLGFPLGDEGSGADIGRSCVRAFYYGTMPQEIREDFARILPGDRAVFLSQMKSDPAPNTTLAGLVKTLSEHRTSAFTSELLEDSFRTFVRFHILPYAVDLPVHVTGGIGHVFGDIFADVLREHKLRKGTFSPTPLAGLIAYHQKDNYD